MADLTRRTMIVTSTAALVMPAALHAADAAVPTDPVATTSGTFTSQMSRADASCANTSTGYTADDKGAAGAGSRGLRGPKLPRNDAM